MKGDAMTQARRGGFTLVEVMVSVALLATAFVSLLVLQRLSVSAHYTVQKLTIASMIAEDRLERMILRAQGFDNLSEYNEELDKQYPDYDVEADLEDVGPEMLPVVILLPEGLTLKRVKVTVRWKEGETQRKYELQDFVTQKLI